MAAKETKSTLDSLKRVFNAFRRKPSLVAPDNKWDLLHLAHS